MAQTKALPNVAAPPYAVRVPSKVTLKKYGLTFPEWLALYPENGCAVCGRIPASGTLHIDHKHVKCWRKMKPADRAKYVRALLCFRCNRRLVGQHTLKTAYAVVNYLERFRHMETT